MTTPRKNTLLCATLTMALATLLIQGTAFADLTFGREKLKGTSKTTGDFNLQNRFSLEINGVEVGGLHQIEGIETEGEPPAVSAGASVTFRVPASLVTQNGPLTFQWQKNGVNIAGATGAYTVVAANAAGSATSNGAVLQVVESRK